MFENWLSHKLWGLNTKSFRSDVVYKLGLAENRGSENGLYRSNVD
jgi:hypothetical protein